MAIVAHVSCLILMVYNKEVCMSNPNGRSTEELDADYSKHVAKLAEQVELKKCRVELNGDHLYQQPFMCLEVSI